MASPNFAVLYAKARGSKAFLIALCTFVGGWLTLSGITGFDADHGLINLFLSLEASISLAFFTMVSDKQTEAQNRIIEDIHRLGRAILTMAEAQRDQMTHHSTLLHLLKDGDERLLRILEEANGVKDGRIDTGDPVRHPAGEGGSVDAVLDGSNGSVCNQCKFQADGSVPRECGSGVGQADVAD